MSQSRRYVLVTRTRLAGTRSDAIAVHGPYDRGEATDWAGKLRTDFKRRHGDSKALRTDVVALTSPLAKLRAVTAPINARDLRPTFDPDGIGESA